MKLWSNSAVDIEWVEELPERVAFKLANKPGRYVDLALGLKQRPGDWAKFPEDAAKTEKSAKALAQSVKRGSLAGFTPGFYEAIADVEDKDGVATVVVYVRCLPEDKWPTDSDDDPPGDPEEPEPDDDGRPSARVVRQWAVNKGLTVPERGRLPADLTDQYLAEHARSALGIVR